MLQEIQYRDAIADDAPKLSILFSQVYIHSYGTEGVSTEYSNYIHKQFAVERLRKTITDQPGLIKVATYKENLVGVVEITLDVPCPKGDLIAPEINKLYVLDRFSGVGIGKSLIQKAEEFLKTEGYRELWLWVWLPNLRAQQFYLQQQYVVIGNAYFEMDENTYENVVMWKKFSD